MGNHHEKLGLKRISCASQFTIPDKTGTSPDPAGKYIDSRSSQPNQACRTPHFSYPLISSISFPSSSSISLSRPQLDHHQKNTMLSHPTLSLDAMIKSWHRVQHTQSTASTQDCLSSLNSHDYELTAEYSFSFQRASLHDRPPSASSPWELKCEVRLSHSHGCELSYLWTESQHRARGSSTAS